MELQTYAKILPTVTFNNTGYIGYELIFPDYIQRPIAMMGFTLAAQSLPITSGNAARWIMFIDPQGRFTTRTGYPAYQDTDIENLMDLVVLDLFPGSKQTERWEAPGGVPIMYYEGDRIFVDVPSNGNGTFTATPVVEVIYQVPARRFAPLPPPPPTAEGDAYTKLQLHFNGANNTTIIQDYSPSAHAVSCFGTAKISTSSPVFGTGSLLIDGVGGAAAVSPGSTTDFNLTTGDWTVDFWFTPLNTTSGGRCLTTIGNTYTPFMVYQNGTALTFYSSKTVSGWDAANGASLGSCAAGVPVHIEVCRYGNVFKLFNNGVKVGSDIAITGSLYAASGDLFIGAQGPGLAGQQFNIPAFGLFDEFRLSKGIARHTANFTPPTAAYS